MVLQVNRPNVISETIEGETIIIHLLTGTYYSLRGSAADVWSTIERSTTRDEIVAVLGSRYDAAADHIENSVESLLGDLQAEDLIVMADTESGTNGAGPHEPLTPIANAERLPFPHPSLEKFTDMQDIILLDPVHEVSAQGWPHRDPQSA
jgi:hypothetical protein